MDKQTNKKTRKDEKREKQVLLMSLLVIVTMLFSGLYFFGSTDSGTGTPANQNPDIAYNSFTMMSLTTNASIYAQVEEVKPEIIAIPHAQCVSTQEIAWVYNMSAPGLSSISLEVASPSRNAYNDLCGNFFFFRFSFDNLSTETLGRIQGELDNRLGSHILRKAYVGILAFNMSGPGTNRIMVLGSLDAEPGDIAEILVFQKSSDGSVFGLERAVIPFGPTVPARIVEVTDVIARGTADMDVDVYSLNESVNKSGLRISRPAFRVNQSLGNETTDELSSLRGVSVSASGNETEISFNSSGANISGILGRRNISFTFVNGTVVLQLPLNTSRDAAYALMEETYARDIQVDLMGYAEVPESVILNNRIVKVDNNKRLNTLFGLDAKAGDRINVTLSALSFGDQVFVVGASQEK